MQRAESVLIYDVSQRLPILRQRSLLQIPRVVVQMLQLPARHIHVGEPLKLAILVGGNIYAFAIAAESDRLIRHFLAFWRETLFRAGSNVYRPQMAFVDRDVLGRQKGAVIRRPVTHLPSATLIFAKRFSRLRLGRRIDNVKIQVSVIAQRAGVGDAVTFVRPDELGIARFAVGQHRHIAGGHIEAKDLIPLASADVFAEEEEVALVGLIAGISDTIAEERHLRARTAWGG